MTSGVLIRDQLVAHLRSCGQTELAAAVRWATEETRYEDRHGTKHLVLVYKPVMESTRRAVQRRISIVAEALAEITDPDKPTPSVTTEREI